VAFFLWNIKTAVAEMHRGQHEVNDIKKLFTFILIAIKLWSCIWQSTSFPSYRNV